RSLPVILSQVENAPPLQATSLKLTDSAPSRSLSTSVWRPSTRRLRTVRRPSVAVLFTFAGNGASHVCQAAWSLLQSRTGPPLRTDQTEITPNPGVAALVEWVVSNSLAPSPSRSRTPASCSSSNSHFTPPVNPSRTVSRQRRSPAALNRLIRISSRQSP